MFDLDQIRAAHEKAKALLLAERNADGHWTGELSSSALSTATAISALSLMQKHASKPAPSWAKLILRGIEYLAKQQNADGGFGDTDKSHSNIATTMLAIAAIHLADEKERFADILAAADRYVESKGRLNGLRDRYGEDKTFVVPILTNCALAGLVPWDTVDPLPFELACVPQSWYRLVGMPVVSYAIPALVAIGQCVHFHKPTTIAPHRWLRNWAIQPSLRVLKRMQPDSGGYLEATPLTSFVVMSLAGIGKADHPVCIAGTKFIVDSMRPDGSWPIDTNLATWATTLSLLALTNDGSDIRQHVVEGKTIEWILSCQHRKRHPFTGANPGGWGWTDLSGAVPDADDTPGALMVVAKWAQSLHGKMTPRSGDLFFVMLRGVSWLRGLQNRDGGMPTFCRGWGRLPFDRSGVDLTAHAMRAMYAYCQVTGNQLSLVDKSGQLTPFFRPGLEYLFKHQQPDGSWVPLWFGNQDHPKELNPTYGTAKVLFAFRDCGGAELPGFAKGINYLVKSQAGDGSWGGPNGGDGGSIEETALATEALLSAKTSPSAWEAAARGLAWLCLSIENGKAFESAPIGLYFAKLWYYERLYPLIFSVSALGRAVATLSADKTEEAQS
jgi:squalene-hopene/tetraprenyl-beta-curcumene cyclase